MSNPRITVVLHALEIIEHPLVILSRTLLHLNMWDGLGSNSANNKIEAMLKIININ